MAYKYRGELRKSSKELRGRKVILLREIRNQGGDIFPYGSVMEIRDKYMGFSLSVGGTIQERHDKGFKTGGVRRVNQAHFRLLPEEKQC